MIVPESPHQATRPDLEILIRRENVGGGTGLVFEMRAQDPAFGIEFEEYRHPLERDPESLIREIFRDLQRMSPESAPERAISEEQIEAIGVTLFNGVFPREVRAHLWALRDRISTLQILSDEAHIPWELAKLQKRELMSWEEGPFLCECFAVTRWLRGVRQKVEFPLTNIGVIAPGNSGLREANQEKVDLLALASRERRVLEIEPEFLDVTRALKTGPFDGLHFCGHGRAGRQDPNRAYIDLDDAPLTPENLNASARSLPANRPLVFLNACETGRVGHSLSELGGWPKQFLGAGAGAFLGTLWKIGDRKAREFAKAFYQEFLAGTPIGQSVRIARQEIHHRYPGDPSWLAYTVYAHPLAICSTSKTAPEAHTTILPTPASPSVEQVPQVPRSGPIRRVKKKGGARAVSSPRTEVDILKHVVDPLISEPEKPKEPTPGDERIHETDGTLLVFVPGGEISLGAEGINSWSRPIHHIRLNPFWIGKFLVTNEQYSLFLSGNPGYGQPAYWNNPQFNQPQHPVVGVSWNDAQAYCKWAGLELPSEAQWEAAARGKDQRAYPWGNELPTPRHANFSGSGIGTSPVAAHPAGIGPYGTFDQAGNVWEWCADPWSSTAYQEREDGQLDPIAKGDAAVRALRGGSWMNPALDLRAAYRERATAKIRLNNQGFRCAWWPT